MTFSLEVGTPAADVVAAVTVKNVLAASTITEVPTGITAEVPADTTIRVAAVDYIKVHTAVADNSDEHAAIAIEHPESVATIVTME